MQDKDLLEEDETLENQSMIEVYNAYNKSIFSLNRAMDGLWFEFLYTYI